MVNQHGCCSTGAEESRAIASDEREARFQEPGRLEFNLEVARAGVEANVQVEKSEAGGTIEYGEREDAI